MDLLFHRITLKKRTAAALHKKQGNTLFCQTVGIKFVFTAVTQSLFKNRRCLFLKVDIVKRGKQKETSRLIFVLFCGTSDQLIIGLSSLISRSVIELEKLIAFSVFIHAGIAHKTGGKIISPLLKVDSADVPGGMI